MKVKVVEGSVTDVTILINGRITLKLRAYGDRLEEIERSAPDRGNTYIPEPEWKASLRLAYGTIKGRRRDAAKQREERKREPLLL